MTSRTDGTYVQVPRVLLRSTASPLDVAVWCVLASFRSWKDLTREVYPSRALVMEQIGRKGVDPMPVSRATDRLQRVKSAGVVYEVDPSVGRVGQAVRAGSSGSVTSSTTQVSTA